MISRVGRLEPRGLLIIGQCVRPFSHRNERDNLVPWLTIEENVAARDLLLTPHEIAALNQL